MNYLEHSFQAIDDTTHVLVKLGAPTNFNL